MKQLHENKNTVAEQSLHLGRESQSHQSSTARSRQRNSDYQLYLDNENGLIFQSSAIPISGIATFPTDCAASYSILVLDEDSNEVDRLWLASKTSTAPVECAFTWNLKSSSGAYVKSGRYSTVLLQQSNQEEIEHASANCTVADTRDILVTTDLLKSSQAFADPTSKRVLSIYTDIIRDIEIHIIEGLEGNRFDEPYYVARTTAGFIQQIYSDIEFRSASQFRSLFEEFVSKNPNLKMPANNEKLPLRALFDFLVNYMAGPEDLARATAMVNCNYRNITGNDRSVILSALVAGILPYCMNFGRPTSAISKAAFSAAERLLKVGIKYICAKHVDKSISICRAELEARSILPAYGRGSDCVSGAIHIGYRD